ncbi:MULTISPECIES: OmpA family protein [unclassified Luteimonas]
MAQTAALLPADALKQQLDAAGRVAIQGNFAVDRAEILPDSQPQIEQVLALLKQAPALQLSMEGHTDDSGGAAHNRALSQARAARGSRPLPYFKVR